MNSKFLYAATVAASLLSIGTLTFADEAPLTRAQVSADLHKAIADGSLKRTGCDDTASLAVRARGHTTTTGWRSARRRSSHATRADRTVRSHRPATMRG